jgi:arylsulfatase A-like enzyme
MLPPKLCLNLFACAAVFSCLALVSARCQAAEPPRPNVLLIIVDDLGFGDLSCQGSEDLRTPHIDALFSDSLRLGRLYANCPVCSPTRASVLTGRYPDRVGVPGVIRTHDENSWGYFALGGATLPSQLGKLGYHTAAIGKWHLGLRNENHPEQRGFDDFRGFLGDMMDDYYDHRRHGNNYMRDGQTEIDPEGHATDLFSQWSVDFLHDRSSYPNQPWFLYLAYNAPHTPIQPPQDWLAKVNGRETGISDQRAALVALIEHMDAGIGRVIDTLRQTKQYENTLIVFTSDNGGQVNVGANNGPLRDGKQSMYEGGLRIPGSIRVPGRTQPGTSTDALCATMDFLPTIVDAVGGQVSGDVDGISLSTVIDDPDATLPLRELYFVRREGGTRYAGMTIEALLHGDHKLVHNLPTSELELFDLQHDPAETTNLASKQPQLFRDMIGRLQRHIQRGGQVPWQKQE